MQVALVADSHVPARAESIPDPFRTRLEEADHVIHAGDFETVEVYREFEDLASGLTAVHGNADPVDIGLPAVDAVTLEGVTFVVTHGMENHLQAAVRDHGSVMSRGDWLDAIADTTRAWTRAWTGDDAVIGVGGHTHQVLDEYHGGFRLVNPGTVTGAAPADEATMMTVTVADGTFEVTRHEE